jgi:outer membrane protein
MLRWPFLENKKTVNYFPIKGSPLKSNLKKRVVGFPFVLAKYPWVYSAMTCGQLPAFSFLGSGFILFFLWMTTGSVLAAPRLPEKGKSPPVYKLEDCLELGLQRNVAVLKAEQDILQTQGVVVTAKSLLYPKVTLQSRIEERNDDALAEGTDKRLQRFREYWTVSLVATQSLYSGGINRQQVAIAKLKNTASLVQFQAVTNEVLREIRVAVYDIIVNRAQIEAQEKTTELLTEEVVRQQQYFEAGKTTRFNVLRTQVSLANQKAQLYQAQSRLGSSQLVLARLLNIEWVAENTQEASFIVLDELSCPPVKETLSELTAMALARRPELVVLGHQIEIAERQIKVDKASNIPRVDAFAGYEVRRDQSKSSFEDTINAGTVGLLGSWNIFDGFKGRGQAMSNEALLNSTKISLESKRCLRKT